MSAPAVAPRSSCANASTPRPRRASPMADGVRMAWSSRSTCASRVSSADNFKEQETDQKAQAEVLKASLKKLGEKLAEANAKRDLLIAQHRRARSLAKAGDAETGLRAKSSLSHIEDGVLNADSISRAASELIGDDVENRFASMEKDDQINRLLSELKARRRLKP